MCGTGTIYDQSKVEGGHLSRGWGVLHMKKDEGFVPGRARLRQEQKSFTWTQDIELFQVPSTPKKDERHSSPSAPAEVV